MHESGPIVGNQSPLRGLRIEGPELSSRLTIQRDHAIEWRTQKQRVAEGKRSRLELSRPNALTGFLGFVLDLIRLPAPRRLQRRNVFGSDVGYGRIAKGARIACIRGPTGVAAEVSTAASVRLSVTRQAIPSTSRKSSGAVRQTGERNKRERNKRERDMRERAIEPAMVGLVRSASTYSIGLQPLTLPSL